MHGIFKGIAARGKCSMGWFFGFKLHLICNEKGELLNFMFTPGDIDDRKPLEYKPFIRFQYLSIFVSLHLHEHFSDNDKLNTETTLQPGVLIIKQIHSPEGLNEKINYKLLFSIS
jgi:hypothetical protein